jgi:hypothetical protein
MLSGKLMPANKVANQCPATNATPEIDAFLSPVYLLPEADALQHYARLSPRLQWLARQRATGPRRAILIAHHALATGQIR